MIPLYRFYIEIYKQIDTRSLWEQLKSYRISVTDLLDKAYIYGKVEITDLMKIIRICLDYADLVCSVYKE